MCIWACMFIDGSQTLLLFHNLFFSVTFGTIAPKSKKRRPEDATLESQGPPTAPVNATIWQDMLEPAIQYIRNLPQFSDWDYPQPLKVRDDTVDKVGGFMAPFCKQRLHPGTPHRYGTFVLFHIHSSTTNTLQYQGLP